LAPEARQAALLLRDARRLLVLTGAGMSQESGVATFRDAQQGLWAQFDPAELATEAGFRRNPARVFGWYVARVRQVRAATPHAGYAALAELAGRFAECTVVTQNVDGLHTRAGSRDVVELHGSLERFRCLDHAHAAFAGQVVDLPPDADGAVPPPPCGRCGSPLRPGVVWFGESLPAHAVERAWQAAAHCDAALVIGTSSIVYPTAELPVVVAGHGAPVIEINPDPTPLSSVARLAWRSTAARALPELVLALAAVKAVA
jgi:NAD-dependent deacetylase